jgi:hypothetical protein
MMSGCLKGCEEKGVMMMVVTMKMGEKEERTRNVGCEI